MNVQEPAARFAEALVSEVKAEMGRQSLSSRALGRLIGKSSQYMSDRLDGGSSKTGRRTPLNTIDLAAISSALGLTLTEMVLRAEAAMEDRNATVHSLDARRTPAEEQELPAAAFNSSKIRDRAKYQDDSGFEGA